MFRCPAHFFAVLRKNLGFLRVFEWPCTIFLRFCGCFSRPAASFYVPAAQEDQKSLQRGVTTRRAPRKPAGRPLIKQDAIILLLHCYCCFVSGVVSASIRCYNPLNGWGLCGRHTSRPGGFHPPALSRACRLCRG